MEPSWTLDLYASLLTHVDDEVSLFLFFASFLFDGLKYCWHFSFSSGDWPRSRGGGALYLSGFAPDREARSQPVVTVAGGPGVP